jgi:hypothetical protein
MIIRGWFERAEHSLRRRPDHYFEPFIYGWIAFNGWASCCSKEERDMAIIRSLGSDRRLCTEFIAMRENNDQFTEALDEFHEQWPILKAIQLRERGLLRQTTGRPRRELIDEYLTADRQWCVARAAEASPPRPIIREPDCHQRHWDAGQVVPKDWPHTLAALYRVRCNLFHGEKADHTEMDRRIVGSAVKTILPFIRPLIMA